MSFADEMRLAVIPQAQQMPRPGSYQFDQQLPLEMMPLQQRMQQFLDYRPDEWSGRPVRPGEDPAVLELPSGGHRLYNPSRDDRRL
jgi:hypothetical protein